VYGFNLKLSVKSLRDFNVKMDCRISLMAKAKITVGTRRLRVRDMDE
jgi:hypothetical protein